MQLTQLLPLPKKVLGQVCRQELLERKYGLTQEVQLLVEDWQFWQLAVHKVQTDETDTYPLGHVPLQVLSGLSEYEERQERQLVALVQL